MPERKYRSTKELPDPVEEKLPEHAQHIYKEAHNAALEQYRDPKERRGDASIEETAHRVAWAAVKKEYRKNERGEWVRRSD